MKSHENGMKRQKKLVTKVERRLIIMKFCPNCGAKVLIENAKFCMECGTSFKDYADSVDGVKEEPHNDFFSEAAESSTSENDGGFFSEMGEAVKEEDSANKKLIEDATKYFIRGDLRTAERILSDVKKKDRNVMHMLAVIYEFGGEGVDKDSDKALELLKSAGLSGIICVNFFTEFIGEDENAPHYKEFIQKLAIELPKAEEECQSPFDEAILGVFYVYKTPYQDFRKAKMYLEKAASHGMWCSEYILGAGYENGAFGGVDYNKAYYYYERAAKKGSALAARDLATMLYWGNGCNENHREAKKWYSVGAKQNDSLCMHQLGIIYEEEENYHEAIRWLEKSASLPNSTCQENSCAELGLLLMNGNNIPTIPTNHIRGYQFIKMALSINPKNGEALLGLAICYFSEEIPEMADIEPEQRIAMFKKYCKEAIKYSDGAIRDEARNALAQIERMERESANQQNNDGCFITTAVCDSFGKADDCYELTMFRSFRDNWLLNQTGGKDLIDEYYRIAPRIVDKINQLSDSKKIYFDIWEQYLKPCLSYIETKEYLLCTEKYIEMVHDLKNKFYCN